MSSHVSGQCEEEEGLQGKEEGLQGTYLGNRCGSLMSSFMQKSSTISLHV